MKLRKFQKDILREYRTQVDAQIYHDVLLKAVTGAGKTAAPLIAFNELRNFGLVDKICFVVPREPLKQQTAESAIEGIEVEGEQISLQLNEATNEIDPSRGLDGFITTYQALTADRSCINAAEIERTPYLVVLDECHHIAVGSSTEKSVRPIIELAAHRLFMSGTLERGDHRPIAFLPYEKIDGGIEDDIQS